MILLIDPFTFKPKEFSVFAPADYKAAKSNVVDGKTQIEFKQYIQLEVEYDASLLEKTYDPETNTLV